MAYIPTQEDILLLHQANKRISVSFELLNKDMQVIDLLEGEVVSGNFTVDVNSDIRRILDVEFFIKNKSYYITETSKIWLDKIVKVKIGIDNNRTKKTVWYSLGLFIFTDYNFKYDSITNLLFVNCVDLMAIFTGSRGGVLRGVKTLIPRNSLVRKVVVDTVTQLGGIKKYIVNESTDADCKTIPYDLEFGSGITVYEILDKIKCIYPRWEMFFDEEVFVYQEFSTSTNDSVVLDNTIMGELVISENTKSSFTDIKNCIEIFGLNDLNGRVKLYNKMPSVIEENVNYIIDPLSPFSVEKIGEVWSVFSGGEYEKIYTQKLILDRCTYELWLATAMKESIGLTTIFIPFLKVNDKISYKKKFNNESADYLVQRISFDLTSGISDIELVKFTPLYSWL